jgi:hypothetical protein
LGTTAPDGLSRPTRAGSLTARENPVKVRTLIIVAVIVVGVTLLVSSGLIGAGVCV